MTFSRPRHLCRHELRVHSAAGQKLLMCALFDHLALVQHQYVVHVAYRRQSVCNHHRGSALHEAIEGVSNSRLANGVQVGSGLVQDQHRSVLENRAGNRDPLPLTARKLHSSLSNPGVVTVRE